MRRTASATQLDEQADAQAGLLGRVGSVERLSHVHGTWPEPGSIPTMQDIQDLIDASTPAWSDGFPTYDARYVLKAGDVMTGHLTIDSPDGASLRMRRAGRDDPFLTGESEDGTTRYGFLQIASTHARLANDAGFVSISTDGADHLTVDTDGMTTLTRLAVASQSRVIASDNVQALLVGSFAGTAALIGFYPDALSLDSPGTRRGYVGPTSAAWFDVASEAVSQGLRLVTPGHVVFSAGGSEKARLNSGGTMMVGKATSNFANNGVELLAGGSVYATVGGAGAWNFATRKNGDANVNGQHHCAFFHAGSTAGTITRTGGTAVAYNTSSDERLKDDLGEIDPEVAAYVMRLVRPHWFRWKSDGEGSPIVSGYLAQRVAALWPGAVEHGLVTPGQGSPEDQAEWQSYDDDRARRLRLHALVAERNMRAEVQWTLPDIPQEVPNPFTPWQMDMSKLTPVLHAAWLWDSERVDALSDALAQLAARVEALESAA